jgi:hypothetical protein
VVSIVTKWPMFLITVLVIGRHLKRKTAAQATVLDRLNHCCSV